MMIESGFFNRMKKLQVIRMLGSGMDIGELNEYAYEICFLLIQNIFLRELRENHHRTRDDMLFITEKILQDMDLLYSKEEVERIVDGTLWYREPTKQEGFKTRVYHETTRTKEEYIFRYFKVDREHSHWEQGGSTVYMLTEESQEMIFITREILEEFGFNLEQFYTLQLIKTGNFMKARNSIDNLMARVRVLINREKEYRRDIIRDPQNIFFDRSIRGKKSEDEIKGQFEEEQKVFANMFSWRNRYDVLPEDKKQEAEMMFENLEGARLLHDSLAKHVMENLALELEIRVKYPESFWNISSFSFKKDIWQNHIVKNGLRDIEDLEKVVSPLFSPKTEFIYPLEWAWSEQMIKQKRSIKKEEDMTLEDGWKFRETDWELLIELYEEIFTALLENGRFSILELNKKSEEEKGKWLRQRENVDLFMMFVISKVTLDMNHSGEDERLRLFKGLCSKNPIFKELHGKKILSKIEDAEETFVWKELFISPYTIYIEE
ncbi:hypothetical protein SAMN05660297_03490 [Natronincola peptidivorans]|uniref:Uncharacterized protein n=1 Tax=Natronincola peptidivorans TaxID=426128 RepID=A0A1I0H677_9FIRM|nr:hypothetical protein [Natronincola peptidivorans]SET78258.1 hypothetical protein SAMN05660297_03490 [Natronincola peptidivorans]